MAAHKVRAAGQRARRAVQIAALSAFALLAWGGTEALTGMPGRDLFVRLDPAAALAVLLADRSLTWKIAPGLLILASALLFGRAFCGWLCPMGAMLDLTDRAFRARRRRATPSRALKYGLLAAILLAAIPGANLAFWAAPLPLTGRLWSLALWPPVARLADTLLALIGPAARRLGETSLAFAEVRVPVYSTAWFSAAFFALVIGLGLFAPRLWCRMLCPAGAALGLLGRHAAWRRDVCADCTGCGACSRTCPAGAIPLLNPRSTDHAECLKCLRCRDICPERAIRFPLGHGRRIPAPSPVRRALTLGMGIGVGAAILGNYGPALGRPEGVLRPPGSLPEPGFLARCVRCGLCAAACPTNTLQPAWMAAGTFGMFSPVVTPSRGFCDPACHACAGACPTAAIRPLAGERTFAKLGTAEVIRKNCLAWEKKKKCLVCDEVCPYDAVSLKPEPGNPVAVPHVDPKRCAGCGFCEKHCPVLEAKAIVVRPTDAIRLRGGSVRFQAEKQGLRLEFKPKKPGDAPLPAHDAPGSEGLPPGFSE